MNDYLETKVFVYFSALFLVFATPSLADVNLPMFAGETLTIHGQSYNWAGPAVEEHSEHRDTYTNPNNNHSVLVTGLIGHPDLASVFSIGDNIVNGYLSSGAYMDCQVVVTSNPGTWVIEGVTFTSQSSVTNYNPSIYEQYVYQTGTEDYTGPNGTYHLYWEDTYDYTGGWWTMSNLTQPHGHSTLEVFGTNYVFSKGSRDGERNASGNMRIAYTDEYTAPGDRTLKVTYTVWPLAPGVGSIAISAWDHSLGTLVANLVSGLEVDFEDVEWKPRVVPAFAKAQLWVDGKLMNWQSGAISSSGHIVDNYSGGDLSLTISGNRHNFFDLSQNATVAITAGGSGTGQLAPDQTFTVAGHTLQNASPNRGVPLFTGDATLLSVAGAPGYRFVGGYQDGSGNRTDVFVHATRGEKVTMMGSTGSPSTATVKLSIPGTVGGIYSGSYSNGNFTMSGSSVAKSPSGSQPAVFGPPAFWVAGQFYRRDNDSALTYHTLGGDLLTVSGTTASRVIAGTGFSGPAPVSHVGAFFLQDDSTGQNTVPAVGANEDGSLQVGFDAPPADCPPAVMMTGQVLSFLGTDTGGSSGETHAFYGMSTRADTSQIILIIDCNMEKATYIDYSTGVSATAVYSNRLLRANDPSGIFPIPAHAVDPSANNALWSYSPPQGSGLPPSFMVRGQAWWYAAADDDYSYYVGPYVDQQVRIERQNGYVSLTDPVFNAAEANPYQVTWGSFSAERQSIRMDDNTQIVSGNDAGTAAPVVPTEPAQRIHTIASDLDIVGNNLSFGILQGDASLAGALLQFSDLAGTTTLQSTLSCPQSRWIWSRTQSLSSSTLLPVMKLESTGGLSLMDSAAPQDAATIKLDPRPTEMSKLPKLELTAQAADTDDSVLTRGLGDERYVQPSVFNQSLVLTNGINVNTGSTGGTANTVTAGGAALGQNLQAGSGQVTVGRYNTGAASSDIFVVGAGSSSATKDALTVSAAGNTAMNGDLAVTGSATFQSLEATSGSFSGGATVVGSAVVTGTLSVGGTGGTNGTITAKKVRVPAGGDLPMDPLFMNDGGLGAP